jgi:hypothetical protein
MDYPVRWKQWECPVCRNGPIEDLNEIYVTCCDQGHVCLLGHAGIKEYFVWAELDDTFYTEEQIKELMSQPALERNC